MKKLLLLLLIVMTIILSGCAATTANMQNTANPYMTTSQGIKIFNSYPNNGRTGVTWSGDKDQDGYAVGDGTLQWYYGDKPGEKYTGTMNKGKMSGYGTMEWVNGDKYEGAFVDDTRTGEGKYAWPSGSTYEGDWVNGNKTGKGKYIWPNGDTYEGDWVSGNRTGEGTYRGVNGEVYEGGWLDDKWHGAGVNKLANGTTIIGYWRNGEQVDVGESYMLTDKGVKVYNAYPTIHRNKVAWSGGHDSDNYATGYGVARWYYASYIGIDTETGTMTHGKMSGKGVYEVENAEKKTIGYRYEGDFVNSVCTGYGKAWRENEGIYEGEWLNGQKSGKGKYTYANGKVEEGYWYDGKYIGTVSQQELNARESAKKAAEAKEREAADKEYSERLERTKDTMFQPHMTKCSYCGGYGRVKYNGNDTSTCPKCGGSGQVEGW